MDQIFVEIDGTDVSLFDLMYVLKNRLDCDFKFKFNSLKTEIVMACVLPT